jgi:hypothetical protein
MRLRLTLVTMLTAGLVISSAGSALASQGLRQSDNAAAAQYEVVGVPNQPERQEILPFEEEGPGTSPTNQQERQREQPVRLVTPPPPIVERVQGVRQAEAAGSLPFTGFAAIPIVLLGAALLITGLTLHRKASQEG